MNSVSHYSGVLKWILYMGRNVSNQLAIILYEFKGDNQSHDFQL